MLPTFRALEDYRGEAGETRGTGGPLPVGARDRSHDLSHAFVASAALGLGLKAVDTFNDGLLDGAGLLESNHLRGERYSAFRAFLQPVLGHPNLTVLTGAHVLELLWDGPTDTDQGIGTAAEANLVPTDQNSIAFVRSPGQVLNIVYLTASANATNGGFFPAGVNGAVRATG